MREQAYQEYNDGWHSVLAAAKRIAGSEGSDLARVLNILQRPIELNPNADLLDRFGFRLCGGHESSGESWDPASHRGFSVMPMSHPSS